MNKALPMRILLVRPDGIGDEILCLPVASALRRLRPAARIAFLSSEASAPVLEHHPHVDEVLTVSGRERLGELVALFGPTSPICTDPYGAGHLALASGAACSPGSAGSTATRSSSSAFAELRRTRSCWR